LHRALRGILSASVRLGGQGGRVTRCWLIGPCSDRCRNVLTQCETAGAKRCFTECVSRRGNAKECVRQCLPRALGKCSERTYQGCIEQCIPQIISVLSLRMGPLDCNETCQVSAQPDPPGAALMLTALVSASSTISDASQPLFGSARPSAQRLMVPLTQGASDPALPLGFVCHDHHL